jgi:hypothetical protein
MNVGRLDPKAVERINGPSWSGLRDLFAKINDALLAVSENSSGELTTIYVKYASPDTGRLPFGVVWLKKSTEFVVGLSLPENILSDRLFGPPKGYSYAGLTKFFLVDETNGIPEEFEQWAREAYKCRLQH